MATISYGASDTVTVMLLREKEGLAIVQRSCARTFSAGITLSMIALGAVACGNATDSSLPAAATPSTIVGSSTSPSAPPTSPTTSASAPAAQDCAASQLRTNLPGLPGAAAGSAFYNIAVTNRGAPCDLDLVVKRLVGHTSSGKDVAIPFTIDTTDTVPSVTLQHGATGFISIRTGIACTSPEPWARRPYTGYTLVMRNNLRLSATVAAGKTERLHCKATIATGIESGA